MDNIFGIRLKNARIIRGLSMDDLCAKMNNTISKMTISKYENNKLKPNSSIIIEIAKALELPVEYFFRPLTINVKNIEFRKKKSLSIKNINMIREQIVEYLEKYIEIEQICSIDSKFLNPFKNNNLVNNSDQIIEKAIELRKIWNLGKDAINNVIELLGEHDVKIIEFDFDKKFDGFSSYVNNLFPVIVLNKNFTSERKRLTALHELAHILFVFPDNLSNRQIENLCNIFANEFLLPESIFKELIGPKRKNISYIELESIQRQYGISIDALIYKAKFYKIITENFYKNHWILKNRSEEIKNFIEKELYQQEVSYRFKRLVYKALSSELISISKAAYLLNKNINDLNKEINYI